MGVGTEGVSSMLRNSSIAQSQRYWLLDLAEATTLPVPDSPGNNK